MILYVHVNTYNASIELTNPFVDKNEFFVLTFVFSIHSINMKVQRSTKCKKLKMLFLPYSPLPTFLLLAPPFVFPGSAPDAVLHV